MSHPRYRFLFVIAVPFVFSCANCLGGGVCEQFSSSPEYYTCLENMDQDECSDRGQSGLIAYHTGTSCPELGYSHELSGGWREFRRGPDDNGPGDGGSFANNGVCTGTACSNGNGTNNGTNKGTNKGTNNGSNSVDGIWVSETHDKPSITGESTALIDVRNEVPIGSCIFSVGTGMDLGGSIPKCIIAFVDTYI
jgi:hypothetical protein